MKIRALSLAVFAVCSLALNSCLITDDSKPKPYDEKISNLPHSTPENWQGSAAFGSFFPQSN